MDNQTASDLSMSEHIYSLMDTFSSADLALKLAIQNDDDAGIRTSSQLADSIIEEMLSIDFVDREPERTLYKFLFKTFVLDENTSFQMRKTICEKVLGKL